MRGPTWRGGAVSSRGRRAVNQDACGLRLPEDEAGRAKGAVAVVADGISSSGVAHEAAQAAVKGFIEDYYSTSDAWSVPTAAYRVIDALNAWLYAHSRRGPFRYDRDRGYVCTFSAVVLRGTRAHVFHVGDARVYRLRAGQLEQLTEDHRVPVGGGEHHLARALGCQPRVRIDHRVLPLAAGDRFVLLTDGVHEALDASEIRAIVAAHEAPQAAARALVDAALGRGAKDDLTAVVIEAANLPAADGRGTIDGARLPPAPPLAAGGLFEGYRVLRPLSRTHRSHLYLVRDETDGERRVLKVPSAETAESRAALDAMALEDWALRRIDHPHVLRAAPRRRPPEHLYVVTEYVEGSTLRQWLLDHPRPSLDAVRDIAEQIARGLDALHRLEMLHQDLRPENVMIDRDGVVKLIDLGSVRVAGLEREGADALHIEVPGAIQYAAPEYFLGDTADRRADVYAFGVLLYEALSGGALPYGTAAARCRRRADLRRLRYRSLLASRPDVPPWVDRALQKAVHPDPMRRHEAPSELVADLRRPNPALAVHRCPPLAERHPEAFWKAVSLLLACALFASLLLGR
ncbi:MAG: protein kinase [Gammaproteobacteria bacterium]|nr:MAG: protein kinase [Gammaproteobacteria bacterium]